MQFFEHQRQARSRTGLLLFLYGLSLFLMGVLAGAATHGVLLLRRSDPEVISSHHVDWVLGVTLCTWATVFLGSWLKLTELRGGGSSVAERLGGTMVVGNTRDPLERRLLNVVEEMSIAAGMPVCPVYVLRSESGINAFAAGWSQDDAVIAVTQGALLELKRHQLQAVIAHELSHVLNRDCSLNMQMSGLLHGLMLIATAGRVVLQFGLGTGRTLRRRDASPILLVLGGAIWILGAVGALAGRLIQSAVSMQREYLADASAVQFTRDPSALAGALATIACGSSHVRSPYADENSHLLIADPMSHLFSRGLVTHPSLFSRIQRILPHFDGNFDALRTPLGSAQKGLIQAEEAKTTSDSDSFAFELEPISRGEVSSDLYSAAQLLAHLPGSLRRAAEEPFSARALILAWMIDDDPDARATQVALVGADPALSKELDDLLQTLGDLDPRQRLPLFDIALASLSHLSASQKAVYQEQLDAVGAQLTAQNYQGYCLFSLARRHLSKGPGRRKPGMLIKNAAEVVLGVMAHLGHAELIEQSQAFERGKAELGPRFQSLELPALNHLEVSSLDRALLSLLPLPLERRRALLTAAESTAMHDGIINPKERELLRTLSVCLEVAAPPPKQATSGELSLREP